MISVIELEEYLHFHIPISAYMGAKVVEASEDRVRIEFPLEPNINHRQSVFGGSESSAAIFAAWSLLWVRCKVARINAKLVIQENSMTYSRPILGPFVAQSNPLPDDVWIKFKSHVERRGIARIEIRSELFADNQICAQFSGTFVAIRSIGS